MSAYTLLRIVMLAVGVWFAIPLYHDGFTSTAEPYRSYCLTGALLASLVAAAGLIGWRA